MIICSLIIKEYQTMTIIKVKDDFSIMIGKLHLTLPLKHDKYYKSEVLLDGEAFQFQTTRVKLSESKEKLALPLRIIFNLEENGKFILFLDDVRLELINYIYDNSKSLFNDKQFSKERLCKSIPYFYSLDEDVVSIEVSEGINNIETFNHHNEKIELGTGTCKELVMIVQLKEVLYIKTEITPKFTIRYIKVPVQKQRVEKKDVPIFLNDSDEEESTLEQSPLEEPKCELDLDPLEEGLGLDNLVIQEPEELNASEDFFD